MAKGKSVTTHTGKIIAENESAVVQTMLGPTGNLRAPTVICGQTVLVGFNENAYRAALL